MLTILLIILVIMMLGGVGWGYRGSPYGYPLGGLLFIFVIVVLVLLLTGRA